MRLLFEGPPVVTTDIIVHRIAKAGQCRGHQHYAGLVWHVLELRWCAVEG